MNACSRIEPVGPSGDAPGRVVSPQLDVLKGDREYPVVLRLYIGGGRCDYRLTADEARQLMRAVDAAIPGDSAGTASGGSPETPELDSTRPVPFGDGDSGG